MQTMCAIGAYLKAYRKQNSFLLFESPSEAHKQVNGTKRGWGYCGSSPLFSLMPVQRSLFYSVEPEVNIRHCVHNSFTCCFTKINDCCGVFFVVDFCIYGGLSGGVSFTSIGPLLKTELSSCWRTKIRNIFGLPVCSLSFLASKPAAFNFPRVTVVVASWLFQRGRKLRHMLTAENLFFWRVGGVDVFVCLQK